MKVFIFYKHVYVIHKIGNLFAFTKVQTQRRIVISEFNAVGGTNIVFIYAFEILNGSVIIAINVESVGILKICTFKIEKSTFHC